MKVVVVVSDLTNADWQLGVHVLSNGLRGWVYIVFGVREGRQALGVPIAQLETFLEALEVSIFPYIHACMTTRMLDNVYLLRCYYERTKSPASQCDQRLEERLLETQSRRHIDGDRLSNMN